MPPIEHLSLTPMTGAGECEQCIGEEAEGHPGLQTVLLREDGQRPKNIQPCNHQVILYPETVARQPRKELFTNPYRSVSGPFYIFDFRDFIEFQTSPREKRGDNNSLSAPLREIIIEVLGFLSKRDAENSVKSLPTINYSRY